MSEPMNRDQVEEIFNFSNWPGAKFKLLEHDAALRAEIAFLEHQLWEARQVALTFARNAQEKVMIDDIRITPEENL